MLDFSITVTPSGGDWYVEGSDIALTGAIWNQILMALMGGNVESSTPGEGAPGGTKRTDFWGNSFLAGDPDSQFNSEYERAVTTLAITTGNLQKINDAAAKDLKYLEDLGIAVIESVDTVLVSNDKVQTDIVVQEPGEDQPQAYAVIWDATESELIFEETQI